MSVRTHRHELEKNFLLDWLNEKGEVLKPYATQLTIGGIVVVAAIVGAIYYFSQTDKATPLAWKEVLAAYGEPDHKKIADALKNTYEKPDVKGKAAEYWARLAYADRKFSFATIQADQDGEEGRLALSDAEKALVPIEKGTSDPELLARCRFSLARVYETQGKVDLAREKYQKVAEAAKESALGKQAADALKRLDPQGEATQVIAWLAQQKPQAKKSPGGASSIFDSLGPGFGPGPTLPERPNLSVPSGDSPLGLGSGLGLDFGRDNPPGLKGDSLDLDLPKSDEPDAKGTDTKGADTNGKTDEKPAAEKPAAEKPASEKPTDDKPAAEKPAAEKPGEATKPVEKPGAEQP